MKISENIKTLSSCAGSGNRIDNFFNHLKMRREKGIIAYITAGYPDLNTTAEVIAAMVEAGAGCIEVGLPFSDPVADGPVIQQAATQALATGIRVEEILALCAALRAGSILGTQPLVIMTYYNLIFRRGIRKFVEQAAGAGVDGLIVPDLPWEEADELRAAAAENHILLIPLVAPTSNDKRLARLGECCHGFVYCIAVTGVTGVREKMSPELPLFLRRVRDFTTLPLAAGFGIGSPELAVEVARHCEAVVVGSAVVRAVALALREQKSAAEAAAAVVRNIRTALQGCSPM